MKKLQRVNTGFIDIDSLTGGLLKGSLVTIASRPGMGKTTLATNIFCNCLSTNKILYISLSEPFCSIRNKLARKYSQKETNVFLNHDIEEIEDLSPTEYQKILESAKLLTSSTYTFIEFAENFTDLEGKIEHALKLEEDEDKNPYDMIIVDDLQHINYQNICTSAYENIKQNNDIILYFKTLAREKDLVVILLSNCSRKSEERTGHRPTLTDFNDCEMEVYSDLLLFVLRRDYYDPCDRPHQAELIIAKNKYGSTGCVMLEFQGKFASFENFGHQKSSQDTDQVVFKPFNG